MNTINDNAETNVKIFVKTLVKLKALKESLGIKSMKEMFEYLYQAHEEKSTVAVELRELRLHVISLCQEVRTKLDENSNKLNKIIDNEDNELEPA